MSFTRKIENFKCGNCGKEVNGNGYTNHCPECLYSKHVDNQPGDRAANCGGMMKPIGVEKNAEAIILIHQCEKCGYQKRNKVAPEDNSALIIELSNPFAIIK
jgi:rubrerythrin